MITRLYGPLNTGLAAGGAGVSTSNKDSEHILRGQVLAVYLKHNDAPPVTADVLLKTKGLVPFPPSSNILVRTNLQTDGWFYPRFLVHDENGVALTGTAGGDRVPFWIHDYVNISIAGADVGDSVDVWIILGGYG